MLSTILSSTSRLGIIILILGINGCANVQRPNSWLCGVNGVAGKLRCYNLRDDYTNEGTLKPDVKPLEHPLKSIKELNGWVCMDPNSLEKMKVYMGDLRDYAREHCK